MTLYRNFFENTRPYLLATFTGTAFCSLAALAQAQQYVGGTPGEYAPATSSAEPRLLQQSQINVRALPDSSSPVFLTAGQATQQSDYRQTQQLTQPQNMNGNSSRNAPRQTAFAERFGKIFRKGPTTPPVDPGMTYPKAGEQPAGPPQAPGASNAAIPSIPPATGGTVPQPALFQPAPSVNAIGTNLIPPDPGTMNPVATQGQTPAAGLNGIPLQNIPELKALMVAEEKAPATAAAKQPDVVHTSNLPKLEFNSPQTGPGPQIAPGEPSEPMTAQTPKGNDPFADLFPGDMPKTAQAETGTKSDSQVTQPYTGLSLEAENGKTAATVLPPPPAEEKVADIPAIPPQTAQANQEIKTANVAPLSSPPSIPAAPTLDVSVPNDMAKLSSASSHEIEIKPATPTKSAPTPPAASDDQRSKLDQIAARKDLKGLKGFCPVVLRDERNLVDSSFEFTVSHNGREYALSSSEARSKFLADPNKYAPAIGGCDVIHLALTGEQLEGSLEHAVWYKGRLYLFSGIETMETFVAAPSSHATED